MMLGLTEVTDGTVSVLGRNPAREPLQVKRQVGYLPDTVGFYDHMTALDNLRYTAALIGIEPDVRDKRIIAALDRVGLGDVGIKRVGAFSRGMRQRLGLAEILMKDVSDRDPRRADLRPRSRMRRPNCWKRSARSSMTASRCCCRRICWSACRACATAWRCSTPAASRCSAPCRNWRVRCSAAATTSRSRPTARASL